MIKASDLKKSHVIDLGGQLVLVRNIDVKSPSSRGASTLYKVRFNDVKTGQKVEKTLKGDDALQEIELQRRQVQYLYKEDSRHIFMDTEDYNQYALDENQLENESKWLVDNLEGIQALIVDEHAIAIELPSSIDLEVVETAPAIKGASASSRTKTAKLSSGAEVQVPEYLASGEVIKINTSTGKYMSRA
ncbi:MAG: elongation factor P-like protein YeiP [Gammaproteobacteria bacterium]|nr:elongation factor P-like protein YeiP [Gammaproteobacteria bacterium]